MATRLARDLNPDSGWQLRVVQTGGEALDVATQRAPHVLVVKEPLPDLPVHHGGQDGKGGLARPRGPCFTARPATGRPGEVKMVESSRIIVLVPVFTEPEQLVAALRESARPCARRPRSGATYGCSGSGTSSSCSATSAQAEARSQELTRRARRRLAGDWQASAGSARPDVGQVAGSSWRGVQAVADDEHVRHLEADEVDRDLHPSPGGLGQERTDVEAGRAARPQQVQQVLQGETGVDDVLDQQDVSALDGQRSDRW